MAEEPKDESLTRWGNEGGALPPEKEPRNESDQPRRRLLGMGGKFWLGVAAVLLIVALAVGVIAR